MKSVKETKRAVVHVGFDGRVHKQFLGPFAQLRYENEARVLRYLEAKGCPFVPRLLDESPKDLRIVTTNCGAIVKNISNSRLEALFAELETYGVRHGDSFARNITYNGRLGRFCIIDFEFATILETGEGLTIEELESRKKEDKDKKL